jgi:hypothetical protein
MDSKARALIDSNITNIFAHVLRMSQTLMRNGVYRCTQCDGFALTNVNRKEVVNAEVCAGDARCIQEKGR